MATKLRKLKINEVSAVTRPANPGADILIVKGEDGEEKEWSPCEDCPDPKACAKAGGCQAESDAPEDAEKGMGCGSGMPMKRKRKKGATAMIGKAFEAVCEARAVVIGKSDDGEPADDPVIKLAEALVEQDYAKAATMFDDIVGVEEEREKLWRATRALNDSMHSIIGDGAMKDKPKALRMTLNQFVTYLEGEFDIGEPDDDAEGDEAEETAEKGDDEDAAPGGYAVGGSDHHKDENTMSMTKGAPGAVEALNKAEQEKAAAIAKAEALEKANQALEARLAVIEKAQEEERISKTVDELVGDAVGIDKAAIRDIVSKLDAAGIAQLRTVMKAQQAQAQAASIFATFGKTDAPPAGEAGQVALRKAVEERATALRKAAGAGRA